MVEIADLLAVEIELHCPGAVVVHSDAGRAIAAVGKSGSKTEKLERHITLLEQTVSDRPLWFPTFNYGFPASGRFDSRTDPAQVGLLSEYARNRYGDRRTLVPFFSFCGRDLPSVLIGPCRNLPSHLEPFGGGSVFSGLEKSQGGILFYGAPFHSITAIHYLETVCGLPAYRYDKQFHGRVIDKDGNAKEVEVVFHVRPKGRHLNYDWPKIYRKAVEEGAVREIEAAPFFMCLVSFPRLLDVWGAEIVTDPLYLLDQQSREWVAPELDRLGRRFVQSDFEG